VAPDTSQSEDARQHQVALEYDRRLRDEYETIVSDDVTLGISQAVTASARAGMFAAWMSR